MINNETLTIVARNYLIKREGFSKNDLNFILNRESFSTKLINIFSSTYLKKKKLVLNGNVGVCFTFKMDHGDILSNKNFPTFSLISFNQAHSVDKDYYLSVIGKIEDDILSGVKSKFLNYYENINSRPYYMEVPSKYTSGGLVYLTYIEGVKAHQLNLGLGLNYVLYNKNLTSEVIYLPSRYIINSI